MAKSEAISWFRIQEMFHFDSIHMYGLMGTAVVTAFVGVSVLNKLGVRSMNGEPIVVPERKENNKAALLGGIIFGLGWALTGACPGPIFVNIGAGYPVMVVVLISAVFGAFVHGLTSHKLPK